MEQIDRGLWAGAARHPEWEPGQSWGPDVWSFAWDDGERLMVFDPVGMPDEVADLAGQRACVVVLTCPWHRRDVADYFERWGAAVHVPHADPPDPEPVQGEVFHAGDRLDIGIDTLPGMETNDVALVIADGRAIVVGDTLIDIGRGLEVHDGWAERVGADPVAVRAGLQPALDSPVQWVFATHGGVYDRTALEAALTGGSTT